LRAERGSSVSEEMGESTRFGGDLERLVLVGEEGFVGDEGFGVEKSLGVGGGLGVDVVFDEDEVLLEEDLEDPILGDNGFEDGSFVSFDLEEDFFGVSGSAGAVVFEGAVFGAATGGGVAFGGATFGVGSFDVGSFGSATFEDFVFTLPTG
jgi:hypothetical protein